MTKTLKKTLAFLHHQRASAAARRKFKELIDRIEADYPDIVREAENLAGQCVNSSTATAGACWRILWDKPLYRWGKVENGDKWAAAVRQSCKSKASWKIVADSSGYYAVARVGNGRSKKDFRADGRIARELSAKGVPPERLYSIIGSACFLSKRAAMDKAPLSDIACADAATIKKLSAELGYGWSHITVLHLLTDMGLACKPDLHLNATCKYLGLKIDTSRQPTLAVALTIVDFVKDLVRSRWGTDTGHWLRYADKCLMEASRRNLFKKPSWWAAEKQWLKVRSAVPTLPGTCHWSIDGEDIACIMSQAPEKLLKKFAKAAKKKAPQEAVSPRSFAFRHRDTIARLQAARRDGRVAAFAVKAREAR